MMIKLINQTLINKKDFQLNWICQILNKLMRKYKQKKIDKKKLLMIIKTSNKILILI